MDEAIDINEYLPTHCTAAMLPESRVRTLFSLLQTKAKNIKLFPYEPGLWLERAFTLWQLQYPELAHADAWKAEHCCKMLLSKYNADTGLCLGANKGFWMYDEDHEQKQERNRIVQELNSLQAIAVALQDEIVEPGEHGDMMSFVSRPYPWLSARHRKRNESLLQHANDDLATDQPLNDIGGPYCEVRRGAHMVSSPSASDEAWGVFALCNIPADTTIIVDKSKIWGCNGPSQKPWNGGACLDPIHPNDETDDVSADLRWVRDADEHNAERTLVRTRCLLECIKDGAAHPLDHHIVARLKPSHHNAVRLDVSPNADIAIPNLALLQFGIDILANHNFDTWVLFTIAARLDNNCWDRPHACGLNALFAMFNHSCEPNVMWETQEDHRIMHMTAVRGIDAGEQLFVEYDSYLHDRPVGERQSSLRRWLDGACDCTRCKRETASENAADGQADVGSNAVWNCGIAALPEELPMTQPIASSRKHRERQSLDLTLKEVPWE